MRIEFPICHLKTNVRTHGIFIYALWHVPKHLSAFVSNFKAIRVVLRKLWLKNGGDPHSKSAHFMWFTQTETELIHVYTYVFCIQKPFPLVHYTINKQRRCHFCSLWSYLVIYMKFFFKIWRKWLLEFHEIFSLILFRWPYFSFLNAFSCVFRQNNASQFYFTFLSHHIFCVSLWNSMN